MYGVIYTRYSPGPNQTDQSTEGQLRDCYAFAKTHDITVVGEYNDKHISGRGAEKREEFQRMVRDAEKGLFEVVIVWKTDRFGRSRYDIANYKYKLKKHGVKVLYAKESIPDGPEGIILESMLEGMAEYYSANLAQNIQRGMRESALKCQVTGKAGLGYKTGPDKTIVIDEEKAPIVRKVYTMFDQGYNYADIINELNSLGFKTAQNKPFTKNSLRQMLRNERYTGVYIMKDIVIPGGIPPIIEKDLFDRVQQRIAHNRKSPTGRQRGKSADYLLSGKLYCGHCGAGMVGKCGTSKTGDKHYYYGCVEKARKNCDKRNARKEWLEGLVVEETVKKVLNPSCVAKLAKKLVEAQEKDTARNNELVCLRRQLADTEKSLENLMDAIEQGIFTRTTKQRLRELEDAQSKLQWEIDRLAVTQPILAEEHIIYMLSQFIRESDDYCEQYNRDIIDTFIWDVRLSDDKVIITYNITKENSELLHSELSLLSDFCDSQAENLGSPIGVYGGP